MPAIYEMSKPTVHILCAPDASPQLLCQIQHGLEEEGIPWETDTKNTGDAVVLSWEAATASRLEVGVGLDAQTLALHFSKLPQNEPLFRIPARSGAELVRALGSNAGRLVKKLPLKPMNGR